MHNHFLQLNINKTDVMEISLYPSLMPKVFTHCSLFLDDNIHMNFDTVKQVKNLGFIFDETLCLEPQINQVIKTCYSRLRNLHRIGRMLDKDRKLQLVISYIFSCLDSWNILYYGLSKKLLLNFKCYYMTLFVLCMLNTDFVGEKVHLSLNFLWNCIFYLFVSVFCVKFH